MEYQKITKVSKNSETVKNENDKQILKEIYIYIYIYIYINIYIYIYICMYVYTHTYLEVRQKIIDNLTSIMIV